MSPELSNRDAERAVLARVLVDERSWWDVSDRLSDGDFSDPRHAAIYRGMADLIRTGRIISKPTLLAQVKEKKDDAIDLSMFLTALAAQAPRPEELKPSVDAVAHAASRRKILAALDSVRDRVEVAGLDIPVEQIVQDACKQIEAADADAPDHSKSLIEIISGVIDDLKDARANGEKPGVRTGLRAYDELIGAMLPGQLIVIGGETSSGKTALAMEVGAMLANDGVQTHVSSLEMTSPELGQRLLARWADIPADKLSDGPLNDRELDHAFNMAQRTDIPLYIDDTPQLTTSALQARIARAVARRGIKVAIIDHLQYVKPDRNVDERIQIKQAVDDIKGIAKRLGIVVILVSHISRPSESVPIQCAADIRRPTLRDLYGSSAIEKAADHVLFVHRPIWFLERATPAGRKAEQLKADIQMWEGKAELVLAKRRGGKGAGVRVCSFDERLTWFSDGYPGAEGQEGELF